MRKCRALVVLAAAAIFLSAASGYCKQSAQTLKPAKRSKQTGRYAKPALKLDGKRLHKVRPGDNLTRIAVKYGTTIAALKRINKLQDDKIQIGQKLRVPGSYNTTPKTAGSRAPKPFPASGESYAAPAMSALRDPDQIPDSEPDVQPLRFRLVEAGFKMLGVRYRRSGNSENSGFDCSGLVKTLFSKFNIELPRTSRELYQRGEKIDRDNLEIGDLVFFSSGGKRPTHVGIYVGDNKFLHAARKARQVIISDLNKIWYAMRYIGARRITDLWGDESGSATPSS